MKGNKHHVAVIATSLLAMACGTKSKISETALTTPLDNSAWSVSQWISASDAPVVTGEVNDNTNNHAAEGATASVCLPGENEWKEYGSSTFKVTKQDEPTK